jgi:hypothetical protein
MHRVRFRGSLCAFIYAYTCTLYATLSSLHKLAHASV